MINQTFYKTLLKKCQLNSMIINSLLDNDFYKLTMMHAVRTKYPESVGSFAFINRTLSDKFPKDFIEKLQSGIRDLEKLQLTDSEYTWLKTLKLFPDSFLDALKKFRYNTDYVTCKLDKENQLVLNVKGPWVETILFEVPLLALITDTFYKDKPLDEKKYYELSYQKGLRLSEAGCVFTDFGTRRRRSYDIQKVALQAFMDLPKDEPQKSSYIGTSNIHFSRIFGTTPIGTMAHEWIMGHAGMFGVENANCTAMQDWLDVYRERFSIALTDTYTSEAFFKEFTTEQAKRFHGLRQDSGNPLEFTDKALKFYKNLGIDATKKKIVYSDNLTWQKAIEIQKYAQGKIIPLFGIGTHFTNDQGGIPPLNIVIKMNEINGVPVYKLTDSKSKISGVLLGTHS